jgi:hypothetical protein
VLESVADASKHRLVSHTGYLVNDIRDACIDRQGRIFLRCELGPAMIHDLDLAQLAIDEAQHAPAVDYLWHWDSERHGKQAFCLAVIDDASQHYGFVSRPA